MTKLQLIESSKNYYTLEGELNRDTIAKLDILAKLEQNNNGILDMSGVSHSDTAGLAWLMNILKHTQQQNIYFELRNIPQSLMKLAKISDVDSFLSVQ